MLTSRHRAGVAEDMGTVHCRAASYLIIGVCRGRGLCRGKGRGGDGRGGEGEREEREGEGEGGKEGGGREGGREGGGGGEGRGGEGRGGEGRGGEGRRSYKVLISCAFHLLSFINLQSNRGALKH